jgi:hypothetical protein
MSMKLEFVVTNTPPTQADIERAYKRETRFQFWNLFLTCVVVTALITKGILVDKGGQLPFLTPFLSAIWIVAYCIFFDKIVDYVVVQDSKCDDLFTACEATPEGKAYRQAVLQQGRKFAMGEFDAVCQWAVEAGNRAACKKLYDVPTQA